MDNPTTWPEVALAAIFGLTFVGIVWAIIWGDK